MINQKNVCGSAERKGNTVEWNVLVFLTNFFGISLKGGDYFCRKGGEYAFRERF